MDGQNNENRILDHEIFFSFFVCAEFFSLLIWTWISTTFCFCFPITCFKRRSIHKFDRPQASLYLSGKVDIWRPIYGCPMMSKVFLSYISCVKIKTKITLSNCSKLTDTGFVCLIRKKSIIHLKVYCCYYRQVWRFSILYPWGDEVVVFRFVFTYVGFVPVILILCT